MPNSIASLPRIFDAPSLDSADGLTLGERVREAVAADDVAMVRGLVSAETCEAALTRVAAGFSSKADALVDHKSRVSEPAEIPNYQRLMLGEWGDPQTQHAFYMRLFYNPPWNADVYGMRATFQKLATLRNIVSGAPRDFCLGDPEEGIYTLSRIHQYPSGGGFLASHRDSVAAAVPISGGLSDYIQVLLVMSKKGRDFEAGGGYFERDGKRVFYEDFAEPGDVLLYNGQTLHGVQTVDPHRAADLGSPAGRYSATVTLYRVRRGQMNLG